MLFIVQQKILSEDRRFILFIYLFLGSSWSCSQENQFLRARKNEFCWPQDEYTVH